MNDEKIIECINSYKGANTLVQYLKALKLILTIRSEYHLHTNNSKTVEHIINVTSHLDLLIGSLENNKINEYFYLYTQGIPIKIKDNKLINEREGLTVNCIRRCIRKANKNEKLEIIRKYRNLCLLSYKKIIEHSQMLLKEIPKEGLCPSFVRDET